MIKNYESLFAVMTGIMTFVMVTYVLYLQLVELLAPKDRYSGIKTLLLLFNIIFVITLVPIIAYQFMRMIGIESDVFRVVVTIIGRIGPLAMALNWVLIYRYKIRE